MLPLYQITSVKSRFFIKRLDNMLSLCYAVISQASSTQSNKTIETTALTTSKLSNRRTKMQGIVVKGRKATRLSGITVKQNKQIVKVIFLKESK